MSVSFLQPDAVKELLKGSDRHRVAVVDVRDEDYSGGHINGCIHFPVDNFEDNQAVDAFIAERLNNLETVIVHCFLCQQRGPFCAKKLASRLQNMERKQPKVVVLCNGFKGFKQLYGDDPELIVGDEECEAVPHGCDCEKRDHGIRLDTPW